jgi:hypothetical protein
VSVRGLVKQTMAVPLAAGLNQKFDPRALETPALSRCVDAQFDEIGGIQTRKPFGQDTFTQNINGGGTLTDYRRCVAFGDELLVFTKDALYSWNTQTEDWVSKGTHLAVATTEETVFATTGDQVDADRAEIGNVVVHAWADNGVVYLGATNKTTGAVIVPPTEVPGGEQRPRLVATSSVIMLFVVSGDPELYVYMLDPSDVAGSLASATTVAAVPNFNTYYDVAKVPGAETVAFAYRRTTTTSYTVGTVTTGGVVTASTKARTCDGPLAVSCPSTGTHVQVVRCNGLNVQGDFVLLSGLSDVYTAQAIGTSDATPDHVTAAHRSTQDSGVYRAYVFWSDGSTMKSNWVSTGNTLGTEDEFVLLLNLASRAFDYEGRIYLWTSFLAESLAFSGGFASQFRYSLQQTYFLYRDDAFLVAKAAGARAGDLSSASYLPGVQNTTGSTFAWCGLTRGIIKIGGSSDRRSKYGARSPRDITFTFDSNEARRCARLGSTLFITGGEILQYDRQQITELGFHVYPHTLVLATGSGGDVADGTYAVKQTWRWDNGRGEIDRSTTATVGQVTVSSGPKTILVDWVPLYTTHKTNRPIAVETWRTAVNPTPDAPFYLTTSKDPTETNPNRYLENDPDVATGDQLEDELDDDDLTERETSPENGEVLENIAPPPATLIASNADRLFLAGIAGDPDRVWYSKQRQDGEVAAFHDALTVTVPRDGGAITAIAFLNETLVVFKETAVYALPGDGFDNLGGGQNYGPARIISTDLGAIGPESIGTVPMGLVFKSRKGWQLLNRGLGVDYIGGPVSDYDDEEVVAVHVVEAQHQIRCLTTERMLVLDYLVQQWAEWTVTSGLDAAMWNGSHVYLSSSTGVLTELDDYSEGVSYGLDVETAWIPLGAPGWGRVWKAVILGEYRSTCRLRVRLARNYKDDYFQDKYWPSDIDVDPDDTFDVGDPLLIKHGPSIQEVEALKIRLTAIRVTADELDVITITTPEGEALKLTRLSLELGVERGLRPLAAAQAQ